jgi:hypothetical protein
VSTVFSRVYETPLSLEWWLYYLLKENKKLGAGYVAWFVGRVLEYNRGTVQYGVFVGDDVMCCFGLGWVGHKMLVS